MTKPLRDISYEYLYLPGHGIVEYQLDGKTETLTAKCWVCGTHGSSGPLTSEWRFRHSDTCGLFLAMVAGEEPRIIEKSGA